MKTEQAGMKWYYEIEGGDARVRVFLNGVKCGVLCFSNEQFEELLKHMSVELIPENRKAFIANLHAIARCLKNISPPNEKVRGV